MSATAAGASVRGRAYELARAGAAPLACGLVLLVFLVTWVIGGGGGIVSKFGIQITHASVSMPAPNVRGAVGHTAATYLTIRNLTGSADGLLSATSPAAARVAITRGPGRAVPSASVVLIIPARGSITLSPFGADLVLIDPRSSLRSGQHVQLILRFWNAGPVKVTATVTPPRQAVDGRS
jgi:copper(I)-binding protein